MPHPTHCPHCGTPVDVRWAFCRSCGELVEPTPWQKIKGWFGGLFRGTPTRHVAFRVVSSDTSGRTGRSVLRNDLPGDQRAAVERMLASGEPGPDGERTMTFRTQHVVHRDLRTGEAVRYSTGDEQSPEIRAMLDKAIARSPGRADVQIIVRDASGEERTYTSLGEGSPEHRARFDQLMCKLPPDLE